MPCPRPTTPPAPAGGAVKAVGWISAVLLAGIATLGVGLGLVIMLIGMVGTILR